MAVQRKPKKQKKTSLIILTVIAVMLVAGMGLAIHNLSEKAAAYAARQAELESLLAAEEGRTYELEETSKLQQTLKYIEMIAREKLNLVFPGEVIVKPDE